MSMAAAAAVRRHLLSLSHHRRQPPHLHLLRHLCSSSSSAAATPAPAADASNSDRTPRLRPPPPPSPSIPIVSYAVKPKPPPPETPTSSAADAADAAGEPVFTKEDIRYMKNDMTVSHTKKVAPLPEDKVAAVEGGGVMAEERSIGFSGRVSRVVRVSQTPAVEVEEVPFPTLIQVDKKSREKAVIDLQDAIRRVKANAKRNFDETLEAHVNLAIDRRRSDLAVSGAVVLPHGTGKIVKVAVFAEGAAADEAKAAGADIVGGDELIEEIKTSGKINFDKCIATHSMMQRVTKIGRILRGLTPNAKKGTVTNNVSVAVQEAKQGLLDFRMKDSIVHVGLGKVSFKEEALQENVGAFVNALLLAKPVGLKKTSKYAGYVNSFHLCSTMGPGFAVSIQSLSRAADLYSKMHPK